jgi:hypothetical protein
MAGALFCRESLVSQFGNAQKLYREGREGKAAKNGEQTIFLI